MGKDLVGFATKINLSNYSTRTVKDNYKRRTVRHQPVIIDRSVFAKSDVEREELRRKKKAHKKSTPQEREDFLGHFVKAKLPNWNLSFILTK